jgi:hypothetical protein
MINQYSLKAFLPKANQLRWEIGAALLIKIVLLTGLWFLIFRWQDRPVGKPDMAEHFALPAAQTADSANLSTQSLTKESTHVR